jgi:hypothetical protein
MFHTQHTLYLPKIFNLMEEKRAKTPELRMLPDVVRYKTITRKGIYPTLHVP